MFAMRGFCTGTNEMCDVYLDDLGMANEYIHDHNFAYRKHTICKEDLPCHYRIITYLISLLNQYYNLKLSIQDGFVYVVDIYI